MASLLFAASILTYDKIKTKRAAKKEAKRKGYETRYSALEREHSHDQEKKQTQALHHHQTGSSSQDAEQNVTSQRRQEDDVSADLPAQRRRRSSESERASIRSKDDPSSWVDDVLREREKSGSTGADCR